jgi:hypothetical protein
MGGGRDHGPDGSVTKVVAAEAPGFSRGEEPRPRMSIKTNVS